MNRKTPSWNTPVRSIKVKRQYDKKHRDTMTSEKEKALSDFDANGTVVVTNMIIAHYIEEQRPDATVTRLNPDEYQWTINR